MNEAEELMSRVLSGDGREGDAERLAELLRADAALRRQFGRTAEIEALLGVALEDDFAREQNSQAIIRAIRHDDQERFASKIHRRLFWLRWWPRIATATTALLLLTGAGLWWTMSSKLQMASAVRMETIRWGTGVPFSEGHKFTAGEHIQFEGGLAEFDFMGQGRMIIEGPADLKLVGHQHVILQRGRMVMRVTPAGHGFRVETPRGNVIDLGTEFGVSVDAVGTVETHVLEGKVKTEANDGGRAVLDPTAGLRMDAAGEKRIQTDGGKFYTAMPPESSYPPKYIHWAFDETFGQLAHAVVNGLGGTNADFVLHKMDAGDFPNWIPGACNTALAFDGKGAFAESAFRGIGGGQARTVAFWLRVPKDFSALQGFGILSWGKYDAYRPGEVWQVSINPIAQEGPVGRLRVGLHIGQVVGSTDLRDGQWHHIAVVLYGGSQPDIGTHVLLYVDGQMETVSRRALREVHTEVDQAEHGVWLGRNITYTQSIPNPAQGGFFRGDVDELYIFDSALNDQEVQRLIEKKNPLP